MAHEVLSPEEMLKTSSKSLAVTARDLLETPVWALIWWPVSSGAIRYVLLVALVIGIPSRNHWVASARP